MTGNLTHGGQLTHIAQQYDIPIANWLDLSTGIAPTSYPVPQIPEATWRRLPEKSNALIRAAQQYYQGQNLMPISGSQSMIQLLPELMTSQNKTVNRAFIPAIGYQEHKKAWANSCAKVCLYQDIAQLNALTAQDLVVVINPNNPTGTRYTTTQIGHLFEKIKKVGAMLVIDEAFMDGSPEHSFIQHSGDPQLMILRSMGKFFGLAGLRLGFLAAAPSWLEHASQLLGPWSVSGPAQYIGEQALQDTAWQKQQRDSLQKLSSKLAALLENTFKTPPTGTILFQTIQHNQAPEIFQQLCQQGIYVRLCDEQNALRFGIPTTEQFKRLEKALKTIRFRLKTLPE